MESGGHEILSSGFYPAFRLTIDGLYHSSDNDGNVWVCAPCPPGCANCTALSEQLLGPSRCTSCNEGYTLNKTNGKCETQHSCPQLTYFDENNKQCLPCHSSCARCRGPNPTDCLECHRIVDSNLNPSPACLSIPQFPRFMQSDGACEFDTFSGHCIPCCHAGRLLEVESPKDCFFCLPHEISIAKTISGALFSI
nr:proprotein convertase subtilisin:kexin type 5 [Hymenolepis microstoma]